jgi:hypothetical protein
VRGECFGEVVDEEIVMELCEDVEVFLWISASKFRQEMEARWRKRRNRWMTCAFWALSFQDMMIFGTDHLL